ncbi:hypothetical protein [uncultured Chloroflexus sp.]|uniref:hypothetical protein n=1 Tax=uncultured Chloroflexus sp. TaxID=214040 RepID=UPI00260D78BE|nr:hypothetical protein [uncultured Chloroflexus sp.]
MRLRGLTMFVAIALLIGAISPLPVFAAASVPTFTLLASYTTGLGNLSGETVAFGRNRMFVTNSVNNSLDIVDLSNASAPNRLSRIDLSPYGAGPNSVAGVAI